MAERMMVRDSRGTPFWLDGEALELYRAGKLNLDSTSRTSEDEARLQERLRFARQSAKESSPSLSKEK